MNAERDLGRIGVNAQEWFDYGIAELAIMGICQHYSLWQLAVVVMNAYDNNSYGIGIGDECAIVITVLWSVGVW